MEKIIESNKEQDTYDLGYELGQHAKPGQVFMLVGDLGVGKTVFTKGLAAGLGITEPVSSPTFTIVQVPFCREGQKRGNFPRNIPKNFLTFGGYPV